MTKIHQLAKFIEALNPNQTPARLAFYNYLKNFCSAEQEVNTQLINDYFYFALHASHWQQNKPQLTSEIQFLVTNFNNHYPNAIKVAEVKSPQSIQLLDIENFSDLIEIITHYMEKNKEAGDRFRLIDDAQKRLIALVLKSSGELKVRVFDKICVIKNGIIEPLRTYLTLHYTPQLELHPELTQHIEIAPFVTASFKIQNQRCTGAFIRGYVFQKYHELKGENINEQLKLFYPLKRIEQFFIDRRTDLYYKEIVSSLERMNQLARQGDFETLRRGQSLLNIAHAASENIFIDDKLLSLLIRDLKTVIEIQAKNNNQSMAQGPNRDRNKEWQKTIPLKSSDLTN